MANLRETATWEAGIYQWETSDPVMGGEHGIDNKPTRQLANRTQWLKTELAKAVSSIGNNKTAADEAIALKANAATRLTAGNGLTGGGDLSANRTITLGTPSKITASTTNSVGTNTHTHEIDNASTTVAGVVKLNDTLSSQSASEALTAKQGRVLALQVAEKLGNSGAQTLSGSLKIENESWSKINFSVAGGSWHIRANPEGVANKAVNFNFVSDDGSQNVKIWFPTILNNETVAYQSYVDALIANKNSFKTIDYNSNQSDGYAQSAFYRGNGQLINDLATPKLEMHITHPTAAGNAYARGIGFTYGGDFGLSTTAWGSDGTYLGQKTILTELNGVMLSGDQTISGTKTFSGSLNTTTTIVSGGDILISGSNKTARFGMGTSDCFILNPTARKYLQLKDNGELAYSDDKIILQSMLSNAVNSTSATTVASSQAVKTAYDLANSKWTAVNASTTAAGIVKLNDSVSSTSITEAATAKAVKAAWDKANDANNNANTKSVVTVMTGTLDDGGTIPLPSGYSEAQCRWLVSVNDDNINRTTWDINENGSYMQYRFECYTTGRVVKCRTYRHNHQTDDNVPGRANYIIIGVK